MSYNLKSEYKYVCDNKEALKRLMQEEGFIFKESTSIHDDFLIDVDENMILNNSCIRLRSKNDKELFLTFESDKEILSRLDLSIYDKVRLDNSQKNEMLSLLSSLGYYKYVGVNILKEIYIKKDKDYYYTLYIDNIENVGAFIDFEIYTDNGSRADLEYRFEDFESLIASIMKDRTLIKYRDYISNYLYKNLYKGGYLKKVLVELDKIFIDINTQKIEESIRNKYTILNLELIEKLEQLGISVNIVYSHMKDEDIQKIKRAISSIGYNTHFMDIKEIKEIAVKETLIIEKQKKQDFSEFALVIIKNIEK